MGNSIIEFIVKNLNIFIPVGATLFVFFVGGIFKWVSKKNDKRIKLKSTKRVVEIWTISVEKSINEDIDECIKFIQYLKDLDEMQFYYFTFHEILIDRINNIEFTNYVETFILNLKGKEDEKIKNLHKLILHINYFSSYLDILRSNYKKYETDTKELVDEWNKAFRLFIDLKNKYQNIYTKHYTTDILNDEIPVFDGDDYITSDSITIRYNKFLHDLINIIKLWEEANPILESIKKMFDDLIDPIYKLCNENKSNPDFSELAYEIIPIIDELKIIIFRWKLLKYRNINIFSIHMQEARDNYNELKTIVLKFKNFKLKPFFLIQ